jgi:arylsulfatase A-like enzyme
MPATRPNFLFIVTDQHRADHTGFGGNEIVRTPHLDRLAARSVRFDRAIVANPICMPNRSSIATGRLPSVHGTRMNGIALDWGAYTFMRSLREHGWRTAHFGKCHLQNMGILRPARDMLLRNAAPGEAAAAQWPAGWDAWEDEERHKRERVEMPSDYYGFETVDLVVDHSDVCSGHYYQWLLEQGVDPTTLQGQANALPFDAKSRQVWKTRVPEALYSTSYVTQRTVEYLETRARTPDAPWLAFCSYPDPHHPFTPPGKYFEMYDPEKIPLPATFSDPHSGSVPHLCRMIQNPGMQRAAIAPFAPTAEQFRQMAAAEYGMISMIDDGIGAVLDSLERTGQSARTFVIFTSDHGDVFGDHGLMLKGAMHYEGCVRVPLTIAGPGIEPASSRSLASSLDLAQTTLELAGVPAHHGMQGVSLVPLLANPGAKVRDHVLIEEEQMADLLGVGRPLRMRTLVTEDSRLTLYDGSEEGELFDLERDPRELENLWSRLDARSRRNELVERLARLLMEYSDPSPKPTCVA